MGNSLCETRCLTCCMIIVSLLVILVIPASNAFHPVGELPHRHAVLFDSGPMITEPAGGAAGADISELQSSLGMIMYGGSCTLSMGRRIADDFILTRAAHITSITFYAFQTDSSTTSTINDMRFQILDNSPYSGGWAIWGDLATNRLSSTGWTGIYRVKDTDKANTQRPIMYVRCDVDIELNPGTYWLDWTFGGSLADGPWQPPVTILGETTTGNAEWYTSTGGWSNFADYGTLTMQGAPFIVSGYYAGGTVIDFDDLANYELIGNHYPGVNFLPQWQAWDSRVNPRFYPYSTPNVAYTNSVANSINWNADVSFLSFFISCNNIGSSEFRYSVFDKDMVLLDTRIVTPPITNKGIVFDMPGIRRLEIRGEGQWAMYNTIDHIFYLSDGPPDCIHNGDANLDGGITASDAQLTFLIVLGQVSPTYEQECAADCNGNGGITAADAQSIFLTALGLGMCADPL